jgi:hypothetical protein
MGDEEDAGPVYVYTGERATGEVTSVTAGEEPKVLTQDVTLLGAREGEGSGAYPNGDTYTGAYLGGFRDGKGSYSYAAPPPAEGEDPAGPVAAYEGSWKAGEKSGTGVLTYTGGAKYHGSFKGGLRNGHGTFYYANGDIYVGEWLDGLKSGSGTYIFAATGSRVQGVWGANKLEAGTFTDKYGNAYTGGFGEAGETAVGYAAGGGFALCSGATAVMA